MSFRCADDIAAEVAIKLLIDYGVPPGIIHALVNGSDIKEHGIKIRPNVLADLIRAVVNVYAFADIPQNGKPN